MDVQAVTGVASTANVVSPSPRLRRWNIGNIISRNTNQAPSQRETGLFPRMDHITSSVDRDLHVPSIFGGAIPDHSQHWRDYFDIGQFTPQMGKQPTIVPESSKVFTAVAEPQNRVTGGSTDVWATFQRLVFGPMRNGSGGGSITK